MHISTGEDVGPLSSEGTSAVVRILVVDDNPSVRRYLRSILEQQTTWRVCSEARTGGEALQKVENAVPDVILLDFQMPDLNGLEVGRQIHLSWPKVPILMITVHMSNQLAAAAKAVGIRGACAKSDVGSIVEAVQILLRGNTYFPTMTPVSG
jgi:DNA-binding NarL/FixJ family response regulator